MIHKLGPPRAAPLTRADWHRLNGQTETAAGPNIFGRTDEPDRPEKRRQALEFGREIDFLPRTPASNHKTVSKRAEGDEGDADETWTPPSSQKRSPSTNVFADSAPKIMHNQFQTPTKGTLRLPTKSPLKRESMTDKPNRRPRDDPFSIGDEDDGPMIPESPLADRSTGDVTNSLDIMDWQATNRPQSSNLGYSVNASSPNARGNRAQSGQDGPSTNQKREPTPNDLVLQITQLDREEEAMLATLTPEMRRRFTYQPTAKRRRIQDSTLDSSTRGCTDEKRGEMDSEKKLEAAPPADMSDSIRTAY